MISPAAVIRGGGCGGKLEFELLDEHFWSAFNSVWRLRMSVRPSVVGKRTSSIWIATNFSRIALGVSPLARGFSLARKEYVQAIG